VKDRGVSRNCDDSVILCVSDNRAVIFYFSQIFGICKTVLCGYTWGSKTWTKGKANFELRNLVLLVSICYIIFVTAFGVNVQSLFVSIVSSSSKSFFAFIHWPDVFDNFFWSRYILVYMQLMMGTVVH